MCMNMLKVWNHAVKPGTSEVFVRPGRKKDYNKSGLKENLLFWDVVLCQEGKESADRKQD